MIKVYQKIIMLAMILTAVFTSNAQVVSENFQSRPTWDYFGYTTAPTAPFQTTYTAAPGDPTCAANTPSGSCEGSTKYGNTSISVVYPSGTVTYTLDSCAVAPDCAVKGGCTTGCTFSTSTDVPGMISVQKNSNPASAAFTTSEFASISTIDLFCSWTGNNRSSLLQKSVSGGAWVDVQSLSGGSCGQFGTAFTGITIGETNVRLRIVASPTTPQVTRIHSIKIYGSIVAGIQAAWAASGVSTNLDNNILTLTSEAFAGTVNVINLAGAVVGQKEILKGGQASFVMPTSGLYMIRFISSNNKVYNSKIVVN